MANPTRPAPVPPQAAGPDRRSFLAAAAAGVVAAGGSAPSTPGASARPDEKLREQLDAAEAAESGYHTSQLHADVCLLVAALQYARNVADMFWQDHPRAPRGARCRCRGCADEYHGRLSHDVERTVLILLEVALDRLVDCRCGGIRTCAACPTTRWPRTWPGSAS